jgi:excisionase family DNA binding protein
MKYFTIPEAAKILGKTRQDIWYLVKKNKIQSFKIGRLYAIKEEDLKNYFLKKMNSPSSTGENSISN